VEPPRNHEVHDQEQLGLEPDHDALAEPAEPDHTPPEERRQRRLDRP
jgi:hypothetical protein